MDSETPIWKWTAALVGVVVACFCLGYFVLGSPRLGGSNVAANNPAPVGGAGIIAEATPAPRPSPPAILIQERTGEIEAKRQRDAEAAKKKADEEAKKRAAEEVKRKADETERKRKEEEAKAQATAAPAPTATPEPTPEAPIVAPDAPKSDGTTPDAPKTDETKPTDPKPADKGESAVPAPPAPATPKPEPATPKPTPAPTLYRVRVGSYPTRDAAKSMASELSGRGYSSTVVGVDGAFHVQVGAYKNRDKAESAQKELAANGYDVSVTP